MGKLIGELIPNIKYGYLIHLKEINMFGLGSRLVTLESTLAAYERMSREMVAKLESAVNKISDNITSSNQVITSMLIKHDERIEMAAETHRETVERIKELKHDLVSDVKYMRTDLESLRKEVVVNKEHVTKFLDDKLSYNTMDIEKKISAMQLELNNLKQPTFINSGKTSIIIIVITAILTGFVSFYFGEKQATQTESSVKGPEISLYGSKLKKDISDYNNSN